MGMISIMSMIDELGVREIMVVAHSHCGACHMSYDHFHHERLIH
jgi:carbonic anhydrase